MELKNGNGLNSWFNAILWLNIAFSGLGLIMNLINLMKGDNGFDLYTFGSTCTVCVAIAGFYWLLKAEKVGFYLLVIGCLINAIIAYIQYCNISVDDYGTMYSVARSMAFKGVWTSIGKIIFFMLLMLLRCEGKNVYQVLWNKVYDDDSAEYANMSEEELYKVLGTSLYKESPYSQGSLGEGMTLVRQAIDGYCKPRYLMDDDAKCAYEFMSEREQLVAVTDDDIDWGSLEGLSEKVVDIVKCRAFVFPGDIYHYENGVAEVRWEINPDGRFYCDEDGFGMTNDKEINLYGVIDRKGKVVKKFTLEK